MAQTVLITGASQGSGKATALLFARNGYDVVLTARTPDRLAQVAEKVRAHGRVALAIPADVGDRAQVEALTQKALAHFSRIDVLVNNAGICLTGAVELTTHEDWHRLMNTNFWGYVNTIQALLPQFLQRQQGTIVNIGSFAGKMPIPSMTAYCASKYAVTGLTESLRTELAPKGIHVCAVHPGIINSSFMERAMFRGKDAEEEQRQRQQMESALNSIMVSQPEDIANAVWDALKYNKAETVVGTAAIATEAYRFVPGLMQWAMSRR